MELIINKTNLTIKGDIQKNSSTINYYEIPITFDSSWDNLIIKAVMILNGKDKGKEISVINNKIYIDNSIHGIYSIGFVGYKIKGNEKVYQISTELKSLFFDKGAGEIETESVPLPTPTEWEIYIAQIQSMLSSKQDKLISNVNIKTINNKSILGSGNINIEGTQYTAGDNIIIEDNVISADLSSCQTKIDSTHKLSSDLVDDTNNTNKFVTASEKITWNNKQNILTAGTKIAIANNEISTTLTHETWTFTLDDDSTVDKEIVLW